MPHVNPNNSNIDTKVIKSINEIGVINVTPGNDYRELTFQQNKKTFEKQASAANENKAE